MRHFGKATGGGRRSAQREEAPVLVVYYTLSRSASADLVNVSSTGARIRGEALPAKGEELVMTMEGVRTYGTVMWSIEDECGITFDRPLLPGSLQRLRQCVATWGGLSPDLKEAFEQWTLGIAP